MTSATYWFLNDKHPPTHEYEIGFRGSDWGPSDRSLGVSQT